MCYNKITLRMLGGRQNGEEQNDVRMRRMRLHDSQMAGQMPGLRKMEHLCRGGSAAGGRGEKAEARAGTRRHGASDRRDSRRGGRTHVQRHRRTGSRAGRRRGGGQHGAGGRRPRHRQEHAAYAALGESFRPGRQGAVCVRRGIDAADQAARYAAGRGRQRLLCAGGKRRVHH